MKKVILFLLMLITMTLISGYYAGDSLLSGNAKKVFIPFIYNEWRYDYFKLNPAKVFVITTGKSSEMTKSEKYIPFTRYNELTKEDYDYYSTPANVGYDYNYDNSPNRGYYWIDDYNYGEKITFIPENPNREGYIFGGWHKETECKNRWEYERDTLPEEVKDEEGLTIYQETKLYAKWIKRQY